MEQVSLCEVEFDELQCSEMMEINGGDLLLPSASLSLINVTTNLFVAAEEMVQGFIAGWNFDKK
ncbi:hypothetical protein [Flavihumibacter sp. ZG627]|uniref:hypothetical protein n=1 Tax=Flavihumibacter sp. ZG627 TaxID=1463156 RepID=UPI000A8ECF08|nr:hypothetical protein [Flavihumibacter sp. ZG627]